MENTNVPLQPYGTARRRVMAIDVERAADKLLRAGERPTIERIRQHLGSGSPNTINPILDAWWRRLGARLQGGPAALERIPEGVAHIAEALWLQALHEGRRRAQVELASRAQASLTQEDALELRTHVLSLREGELNARLEDRDRRVTQLELELRETRIKMRKDVATMEALRGQVDAFTRQASLLRRPRRSSSTKRPVRRTAAKRSSQVRNKVSPPLVGRRGEGSKRRSRHSH